MRCLRVRPLKAHALPRQLIEVGSRGSLVAIGSDVVSAKAVDGYQHDIVLRSKRGGVIRKSVDIVLDTAPAWPCIKRQQERSQQDRSKEENAGASWRK